MRKVLKARTPGQRHKKTLIGREGGLIKIPKHLRFGKKKTGGRNDIGRITNYHRGGGAKRNIRKVELAVSPELRKVDSKKEESTVVGVQYDPNRTGRLILLQPKVVNSKLFYMLASEDTRVGDTIERGSGSSISVGNTIAIKDIPLGTSIYNVERLQGIGGQRVRAGGSQATLVQHDVDHVRIRRPSGELRKISNKCTASIGRSIGVDHRREELGKAGRKRNKGHRPVVRGVAMNPVDHPHGGRTPGGVPTVTPWARVAKGKPSRPKGKSSTFIVKSRKLKSINS